MQKCSTHTTKSEMGTIYQDTVTNELMVYDGTSWNPISIHVDELQLFEKKSLQLHKEHPTLQAAWEEYKMLRKLIINEET